jgi:hypothetical protein
MGRGEKESKMEAYGNTENEYEANDEACSSEVSALYEIGDKSNPKTNVKGFSTGTHCAYLEAQCPKLMAAAIARNDWDYICKEKVPTIAAEKLAIFLSIKDKVPAGENVADAVLSTLKRVKRLLVYRNMTVLEAFEKSMLAEMVEFCNKQDAIRNIKRHNSEQILADEVVETEQDEAVSDGDEAEEVKEG